MPWMSSMFSDMYTQADAAVQAGSATQNGGGMPWGSIISAGASLIGDQMAANSQAATNAQNTANFHTQLAFNQAQAEQSMNFQKTMMNQQDAFGAKQAQIARNYDTQMSDTAMQRRVADLKASGLNPLLAIGAGGASTPTPSAASAASGPSGAAMSAPPAPQLGNPGASFANLGNQVNNAIQSATIKSEIDKNNAQVTALLASAAKDSGNTLPEGEFLKQWQAQTQNINSNAAATNQNVTNLQEQVKEVDARIKQIEASTTGQNISNTWAPMINQLSTAIQGIQKQLLQLQVPEAQVKAGIATNAQNVIGGAGGITDSVGSYIGNKAADVHDWVGQQEAKLSTWWNNLMKQSREGNFQ